MRRRDRKRQTTSISVEHGNADLFLDDSLESNDDENKAPPKKQRKVEPKVTSKVASSSRKKMAVARKSSRTVTQSSKQPLPKKGAKSKAKPTKDKDDTATQSVNEKSYMDHDVPNILPDFTRHRAPGIYCSNVTRNVQELDFFQMFFTEELIQNIVKHTNKYAWKNITKKQSFAKADGSWKETNVAEIKRFIALILYMGIVRVPRHDRYWSTKTLFHGLWAREILSRGNSSFFLNIFQKVQNLRSDRDVEVRYGLV